MTSAIFAPPKKNSVCKKRTEVEEKLREKWRNGENGAQSLRFISSESRSPPPHRPHLSVAVPQATHGFSSSGSGIRGGGAVQWRCRQAHIENISGYPRLKVRKFSRTDRRTQAPADWFISITSQLYKTACLATKTLNSK